MSRQRGSKEVVSHGTDALYVVKGAAALGQQQRDPWLAGTNGDLWLEEYRLQDAQPDRGLHKIKAHLGARAVEAGLISLDDWAGNLLSDIG